jgi:hypothetical protein
MRLNDVTVLLERNAQQIGNWVMGKADKSAKPAPKHAAGDGDEIVHLPVMVDAMQFSNISLTRRAPEGTDQVYHLSSFSLHPNESGQLILNSSGELLNNPMRLTCTITSRDSVAAHGAVKAGIQASLEDADLIGQVSTSRLASLSDLQGSLPC